MNNSPDTSMVSLIKSKLKSDRSSLIDPYSNLDKGLTPDLLEWAKQIGEIKELLDEDNYYLDAYIEKGDILFMLLFSFDEPCCIEYFGITLDKGSDMPVKGVRLASIGNDGGADEWVNGDASGEWLENNELNLVEVHSIGKDIGNNKESIKTDTVTTKYSFDEKGNISKTLVDSTSATTVKSVP